MKHNKLVVLFLVVAFLIFGCGKTENEGTVGREEALQDQGDNAGEVVEKNNLVYLFVNCTTYTDGEITSQTEYKYSDDGIMQSAVSTYNDSEDETDYNTDGYAIERLRFNKKQELIGKTVYKRDGQNRVTKIQSYQYGDNFPENGWLTQEHTYEYNLDGSCKNYTIKYAISHTDESYSELAYSYEYKKENGRIVSVELKEDGNISGHIEYEYIEGTDLLKSTQIYNLTNATLVSETEYTYDSFDNLICTKTTTYSDSYEGGKVVSVVEYEYQLFPNAMSDDLNGSTKKLIENTVFNY